MWCGCRRRAAQGWDIGNRGGGHLVPTMPRCVCPKVKDMGPFSALRE